jgi:hypothetical protein
MPESTSPGTLRPRRISRATPCSARQMEPTSSRSRPRF